ncbi:MAG: 30S ribosomal protein S21 [Verrucomicrobiota bacterium]
MPEINVKKGEPLDRALKRLKSKLESEGILDEMRRRRAFETPTEARRRKARAAAKKGRVRFRLDLSDPNKKAEAKESAEA